MGGDGACWELPATSALLDTTNRLRVTYSTRTNGPKAMGYIEFGNAGPIYSYEYAEGEDVSKIRQNPIPRVPVVYTDNGPKEPACLAWDPVKNKYLNGLNTCRDTDYNASPVQQWEYESNYIKAGFESNPSATYTGPTNDCYVEPGYNSANANPDTPITSEELQYDLAYKGAPSASVCNAPWVKTGDIVRDVEAVSVLPDYPTSITLKRMYGYDTPTFGYAGAPGESISMFLPKLQEDLTFEIGGGGQPGTAASKTGTNGGDTIVRSAGEEILIAKGGKGVIGGEAASKVFMFGEDVFRGRVAGTKRNGENDVPAPAVSAICEQTIPSDDPTSWVIDGCLDKGVARETDAEKRLAEDSGFYTILELDAGSKTPSAINRLYGAQGTNMLPGSAGDGGYTFLRSTSGKEEVLFTNHPANPHLVWEYEYYNNKTYTCYKKNDLLGNPTGEVVPDPGTLCQPTKGYPGAVIIVW